MGAFPRSQVRPVAVVTDACQIDSTENRVPEMFAMLCDVGDRTDGLRGEDKAIRELSLRHLADPSSQSSGDDWAGKLVIAE